MKSFERGESMEYGRGDGAEGEEENQIEIGRRNG